MSRAKNYPIIIVGIASALGIAWLIRQRRRETGSLRLWRPVLVQRHGAHKAEQLAATVRQQQTALIAETTMPENQALRWHLKENILPGLALYQVLLQEHEGDRQAALAEVDEAFRLQALAKNRLRLAPLKILPAPFRLFRLVFPQVMRSFPAAGWDIAYVQNDDDQVAFNITRCFYLNTLTSLGAPELTASFCESDDVMAELFPPSIRFVRPHTLGRGDALCDFCYHQVEES
jgi:hypothetical protein